MAFRFRLQRILDFRRAEFAAARAGLLQAEAELIARESHWQRCRDEREAMASRHLESGQLLDATRLRTRVLAAGAARTREDAALARVREAESVVEAHRTKTVEARRRVRALERLRERRLQTWQDEERAQERKAMDDTQGRKGGPLSTRAATLARERG